MVKKVSRTGKRVARAFVAGLGSMLAISSAHSGYYQPQGSVMNTLGRDMARIGADMRKTLDAERRREETSR